MPTSLLRLNPEIPPKLEEIITKALEKDRKLRYRTASDLRADLQHLKCDSDSLRLAAASGVVPAAHPRRKLAYAGVALEEFRALA